MRTSVPIALSVFGFCAGVGLGFFSALSGDGQADRLRSAEHLLAATNGASSLTIFAGDTEFVRLRNQFVIPVIGEDAVDAHVILALTLETAAGETATVFEREPRLRDSLLRVLFAHANLGGFDGQFTEAANLTALRAALKDAANDLLGDVVVDVLIVDIARQDA